MPQNSQNEPTFEIKNLGTIANGKFTQKPLTVFCGPNNSGKTWAMYSLYNVYEVRKSLHRYLRRTKKVVTRELMKKFNEKLSHSLGDAFNVGDRMFASSQFNMKVNDFNKFLNGVSAKVFLMPAERNGLHLFFRELSIRRTALLHHASKKSINLGELLIDVMRSPYTKPIANYIDWLNIISSGEEPDLSKFHAYAQHLQKELAGGKYSIDRKKDEIKFTPYQKRRDANARKATGSLGLHITSSTVKSLFGLWYYLEYEAKPGDTLMIDEPELNIHPANQIKIARLFAQLVNAGLNVVISTHSDYIMQEFNTMILLGYSKEPKKPKERTLGKTHGYQSDEVLRPEQIGAYLFDDHKVEALEFVEKDGIKAVTFDQVIREQNRTNNKVYSEVQDL